ncbi:MAG: hypothetical protein K2N82_04965 [Lachnospiraceae bacterium]|nr:hypothetical protein [Lachnospiraceae bacterium]
MREEHAKERNEMQRQEIRNVVKILRAEEVSEQEIRTRICKQYQINEEQVGELFN